MQNDAVTQNLATNQPRRDPMNMFIHRCAILSLSLPLVLLGAPVRADDPLTVDWITQSGRPRYDYFDAVALGGAESIFALGKKSTPGPDDPIVSIGVVRRYDFAGNQAWERDIHAVALSADHEANVYLAGYVDEDDDGQFDAFIQKLSPSGDTVWRDSFGSIDGSFANASLSTISSDGLGHVYTAGVTYRDLTEAAKYNSDAQIRKYDGLGNLLWMRQIAGEAGESVTGVAADAFGNVFVGGHTKSNLSGENAGDSDAILAKYDSDGELQWLRQCGSEERNAVSAIAADGMGNVFALQSHGPMWDELFQLTKFNSEGTALWTRDVMDAGNTSLETTLYELFADDVGNVYLYGGTQLSLGAPNAGNVDGFVMKYDSQGEHRWSYQIGGRGGDWVHGGAVDESGRFVLVGGTNSSLAMPNPNSSHDAWIGLFHENVNAQLPGDTNGDGLVDLADLNNVRNHFGGAGLGDTNGDDLVDLIDLNNVRNHFGESVPSINPIPEPPTWTLAVAGVIAGILTFGRRNTEELGFPPFSALHPTLSVAASEVAAQDRAVIV